MVIPFGMSKCQIDLFHPLAEYLPWLRTNTLVFSANNRPDIATGWSMVCLRWCLQTIYPKQTLLSLECHDVVLKQKKFVDDPSIPALVILTCSHGCILTVMWLWMSWLHPNMSTNLYTAASLHLRCRSARVYLDAFTPLRSSMGKTGCAGTVTCKEAVLCPCLLAVASTTFSCSLCIALLSLGGRLDPSIWLFMMPSNSLRNAPLFRILVTLCSRSSTLKSRCKT